MGSSSFKYKRPEGVRHKVSMKDYNAKYCNRGRKYLTFVEVFVTEDMATLHFRPTILGKIVLLLIMPILYVLLTLKYGYTEANTAYKDVIFDKSRGSFSVDVRYRKHPEDWEWLMSKIKK